MCEHVPVLKSRTTVKKAIELSDYQPSFFIPLFPEVLASPHLHIFFNVLTMFTMLTDCSLCSPALGEWLLQYCYYSPKPTVLGLSGVLYRHTQGTFLFSLLPPSFSMMTVYLWILFLKSEKLSPLSILYYGIISHLRVPILLEILSLYIW